MRAVVILATTAPAAENEPLPVNSRGGVVLRIPGFDLRQPGAQFGGGRTMEYHRGPDGVGYVNLTRAVTSANTMRLVPNRNYIISILLKADFPRPTEVNVGMRTFDGGGKNVIDNLNGLTNKTRGWQRWEWEFTIDPRATHGQFRSNFYRFPENGTLQVADIAFIELPPREVRPYRKADGVTFRGGPGNLPMRIEEVAAANDKIVVRTTGAQYIFNLEDNTIGARQMLQGERDIALWNSSLPLAGLEILTKNARECVLANDKLTIGVQCDSLMMIAPHEDLMMTCTSRIGGRWNRLACGHLYVVDDTGGMAVNPDIPLGSGRLARVETDVRPGRVRAGQLDFSGISDNQTFVSAAKPGWRVMWHTSPGERLAISVFPPRPYPWADSFRSHWMLTHRTTPLTRYAENRKLAEVALLWGLTQRTWGMSWDGPVVPYDDAQFRQHIAAARAAGMRPIAFFSPYFYYSRDPEKFASETRRLRDTYGLEGLYYDGIPSQEWVVAYEEMRMTREIFADGVIIVHNTGHASNGGPPLGEPSLKIPAVETYATETYGGEQVYGFGRDWVYPKYVPSQYGKANCVGVMKHDKWEGLSLEQRDLMMLRYNGRATTRARYGPVLDELEKLWQVKGTDPDFYEKYYLPQVEALTRDLLPKG